MKISGYTQPSSAALATSVNAPAKHSKGKSPVIATSDSTEHTEVSETKAHWLNLLSRLGDVDENLFSNLWHHTMSSQILYLDDYGNIIDDGKGLHYWVSHMNNVLMAGRSAEASDEARMAASEVQAFLRKFKESLAQSGITFTTDYIVTIGEPTNEHISSASAKNADNEHSGTSDEDIAHISEMVAFLREFRHLFEEKGIVISRNLIEMLESINQPLYDYSI